MNIVVGSRHAAERTFQMRPFLSSYMRPVAIVGHGAAAAGPDIIRYVYSVGQMVERSPRHRPSRSVRPVMTV